MTDDSAKPSLVGGRGVGMAPCLGGDPRQGIRPASPRLLSDEASRFSGLAGWLAGWLGTWEARARASARHVAAAGRHVVLRAAAARARARARGRHTVPGTRYMAQDTLYGGHGSSNLFHD